MASSRATTPKSASYDKAGWEYQTGEDGYVKTDPTLENPRCVWNLLKAHFARYTPEMVEKICGTPKDKFLQVAEMLASTHTPDRVMTILYALGWTQHSTGSQIIRTAAMVQLLLGNIGRGGGVNALRGHSNIQGLTDLGLLSNLLPGYMTLPGEKETDYDAYIAKRAPKPMRPGQLSYWQNYGKFHVSLMKAWYGAAATKDNNWAFDYLPKLDKTYDVLQVFELMHQGKMTGYFAQGFNPLNSFPNKAKVSAALSKLKFLVIMDPLATETSEFWQNHGEFNDVDPAKIQTTVFRLPTTCFAEEDGAIVNSGRWLQWHWKGAEPGEAKTDPEIMAGLFLRLREMYKKDGGAFPDPILNLSWAYKLPTNPRPRSSPRNTTARPWPTSSTPRTRPSSSRRPASCSTASPSSRTTAAPPAVAGSSPAPGPKGQHDGPARHRRPLAQRPDPRLGLRLAGQPAHPLQPRRRRPVRQALGRQAQAGLVGRRPEQVGGLRRARLQGGLRPRRRHGPFIMNPEGVARFFARGMMNEGPFPEHYEPFETPIGTNPMHPNNPKAISNPAARVFKGDMEAFGTAKDFPYAATTYRLTEHFHYWTKHVESNAITQPEQFVEIGEALAAEKGIKAGDKVKVSSNRGYIKAVAVVTKRIKPLQVDGKTVHHVGIPLHWGFKGVAKNGFITNTLTPFVGDANTQTPEFKSFLVNVEKA
jgi:formate dehydrogenase major subunit